jgi:hypothetical protein
MEHPSSLGGATSVPKVKLFNSWTISRLNLTKSRRASDSDGVLSNSRRGVPLPEPVQSAYEDRFAERSCAVWLRLIPSFCMR